MAVRDKLLASLPDDTTIDEGDLRFVVKALHAVEQHWERIGQELHISNLPKIRQDYGSGSQRLIVMADSLLRGRISTDPGREATWKIIICALYKSDQPLLAKELASKLSEFQKFSPLPISSSVDDSPLLDDYPTEAQIRNAVAAVHSALTSVASRWFEICAILGLPLNSLTTIRNDSSAPEDIDKLRKGLRKWLDFAEEWGLEPPSWQVVVDAMAHGAGGNNPGYAKKLAKNHKKPGGGGTGPASLQPNDQPPYNTPLNSGMQAYGHTPMVTTNPPLPPLQSSHPSAQPNSIPPEFSTLGAQDLQQIRDAEGQPYTTLGQQDLTTPKQQYSTPKQQEASPPIKRPSSTPGKQQQPPKQSSSPIPLRMSPQPNELSPSPTGMQGYGPQSIPLVHSPPGVTSSSPPNMMSSSPPGMTPSSPPIVPPKSLQLNEVPLITMKSEDLDELVPLLDPIAPHWDSFMGELGVADIQREKIRENNASLRPDGQCRHCLIAGLKVLPKPVTYGYIASVLEGKTFANEPLASKIRELNQDNEVLKANEAEDFVNKHLLPIVQNWEVFLNRLDLPRAEIRKLPGCDMFAKKCLEEGLIDWMTQDEQPTFEKLKRALECGLITANPALVEKVEALIKKRLQEQPSGNGVEGQSDGFRQPTPAEEEGCDSSGDESERITDDMGWPWRGEKIHYQPYKRGASKTKTITLQEQSGDLTTINPKTNHQRPPVGNFYPMKHFPHGIALIISNKMFAQHNTREGAEKDVKNLRKTFRYLGYEVIIQRDCTSTEIEAFFKPGGLVFQKAKEEHDSFVCCMLSHGGINTIIGTDSEEVNISQLGGVQYNLSKCDALTNKPKLFFIQKCRGDAIQCDSPCRIESDSDKLPSKADYYIHFATVLGQKSTRHMDYGSRYVLELCRALVSESHNSTLSSMHKIVSTKVRAYKKVTIQQPVAEDLLGSSVYFFEDVLEAGSDQNKL